MRREFLFLALACLITSPASAGRAATWFVLEPDPVATGVESEAPLDGFFYSRAAKYEAAARLLDAYVADPKDTEHVIAAGEELFLTWTNSGVFYCSTKQLQVSVVSGGAVLRAALGVQWFGGSINSRENNWQCFRDADKDSRFETVAGGEPNVALVSSVRVIDDRDTLASPLRYERVAPESMPVKFEVGLSGRVVDPKAGRYAIAACIRIPGGQTYCIPDTGRDIRIGRDLPADVDFMDGIITITGIAPDQGGHLLVRFLVKKAPTATRVFQVSSTRGYSLSYASGPAPEQK